MTGTSIPTGMGLNYPRRQLQREKWTCLNGRWKFAFDDHFNFNSPDDIQSWPITIQVPFAPECPASGIADTGFHPRCWYQHEFELQPSPKRVLLHFGAVDYEAKVWLNGQFLGSHVGGHTPFSFEITEALDPSGRQVLTVQADDDPHDLTKPRGKQDWQREPHSIWYPRTSGIWQTVWLEEVAETYIQRLNTTPLLERWEIGCEVFIAGPCPKGLKLVMRLRCGDKILADDRYEVISHEVHRRIALSDPGIDDFRNELLWSPEKPTLINIELELWMNGECVDHVHSYTALRSVSIHRGRFLLNGRPYQQRLILDQGYWPETFMTPPSSEALRKDIELVKSAGFNGVRKHQKVEDPEFLYWADVLGLMVWGEMPSAYRFTHVSVERLTREWTEVIDRDMNHPCVVVWVPFNESWGVPDLAEKVAHQHCVQAMYHLTKTLDPTRPCIGNDGWESTATDILGIHDYDDQPERLMKKYPVDRNLTDILTRSWPGGRVLTVEGYAHSDMPVMLTEFGGIAYVDESHRSKFKTWGYSVCEDAEELRRRYERLLAAVTRIELFCGFCYTQFTDTFQEANGLFRADRTAKFSVAAMARATRGAGYTRGELITAPQPPPLPAFDESENYETSGSV
jgi:beta-galactosidase/beta-glucuronidase